MEYIYITNQLEIIYGWLGNPGNPRTKWEIG